MGRVLKGPHIFFSILQDSIFSKATIYVLHNARWPILLKLGSPLMGPFKLDMLNNVINTRLKFWWNYSFVRIKRCRTWGQVFFQPMESDTCNKLALKWGKHKKDFFLWRHIIQTHMAWGSKDCTKITLWIKSILNFSGINYWPAQTQPEACKWSSGCTL